MIPKPGYKTTELLAALLAAVSSWLFEWQGSLSPKWAALVTAIAASAYSISRGLTKLGVAIGNGKLVPVQAVAPVVAQGQGPQAAPPTSIAPPTQV